MSIFTIKLIAVFTMLLDHLRYAFPEISFTMWELLGRMSYPLFAFALTEGYIHTSSKKNYIKRLIIYGLISQIPFMLFRSIIGKNEWKMLNIMFTLVFGFVGILAYDKIKNKWISIPVMLAIAILGKIVRVDYGWYGILLIYIFYIFKDKQAIILPASIALVVTYYASIYKMNFFHNIIYLQILFILLSLIPIYMYNGEKGRSMKKFFYLFYPIHLLIVYLIYFMKI